MSRGAWLGVFLGVIVLGLGMAVIAALATGEDGSTTTSGATTTSVPGQFDLPLALRSDTLALAQHQRDLVVGIAAQTRGPVEIAAVRAEDPVDPGDMTISLDGRTVGAEQCGRGCSRVSGPVLDGDAKVLGVRVGSTRFAFALPARLPPSGTTDFVRARRAMAALRSYRFTERLSSGQGAIFTRLDVQAPNRLSMRTNTGFRSVIIGKTRWDFLDGRWQRQSFPGLDVRELLMWYGARTPRVVRRDADGAVELAAYSLTPVPSWFRLTVEPSGRVSQARMIAPSHFMFHRYSAFDGAPQVNPPR
ncbi:MAG TPA: hypothetical protein VH420_08855 [Gaiellaceae bacterium]